MRTSDYAFRIGGDEFALLLPQSDTEQAYALSRRLRLAYASATEPLNLGVPLALDHGLSVYPDDGEKQEILIRVADERLYELKNASAQRAPEDLPRTPAPSRARVEDSRVCRLWGPGGAGSRCGRAQSRTSTMGARFACGYTRLCPHRRGSRTQGSRIGPWLWRSVSGKPGYGEARGRLPRGAACPDSSACTRHSTASLSGSRERGRRGARRMLFCDLSRNRKTWSPSF